MNATSLMEFAPTPEPSNADLPSATLRALRKKARTYPAGQLICLEGEPTRSIIFLIEGAIDVYRDDNLIKTIRGEQLFLGYIAYFGSNRRTATLRARTDCEILLIAEDRIESMLGIAPSLALRLTRDATRLVLDHDSELKRYREFGAQARNAMTEKKLSHFVRQAKEGADLKAKLDRLLPAVMVGLLSRPSERVGLLLANEILDCFAPHVSAEALSVNRDSLKEVSREAVVGQALMDGLSRLAQRKAAADGEQIDETPTDDASVIKTAMATIKECVAKMAQALMPFELEGQFAVLKSQLHQLEDDLREGKPSGVIESAEAALNQMRELGLSGRHLPDPQGFEATLNQANTQLTAIHRMAATAEGENRMDTLWGEVLDRMNFEI